MSSAGDGGLEPHSDAWWGAVAVAVVGATVIYWVVTDATPAEGAVFAAVFLVAFVAVDYAGRRYAFRR